MPKRERSPHCPGRLYQQVTYSNRPTRCACLWTDFMIKQNFRAILMNDPDLGYQLTRLLRLFSE